MSNPLLHLAAAGQSVWLDYIHRRILENGELQRLIDSDGVMGLTSNPSIFEQSIGQGTDYDDRLRGLLDEGVAAPAELYERLAISDVRTAADQLRPAYDRQAHRDGYVSLEVSPHLAMDTVATVAEARRLWRTVDRPNLMIKVPGTGPGAAAVRQLIGEGININVTLLFGIEAYLAAAEAHVQGLEILRADGGNLSEVHGVASFFISRIDTEIDASIDRRLQAEAGSDAAELTSLRGKVAIANAKIAYQRYQEMVHTVRWRALADAGAAPQRLLWASIGVKDPAYSDVHYVESLIGPDTVATMPAKTLEAFRSRGHVSPSLTERLSEARDVLALAERLGLDLDGVTEALVVKGVRQFTDAFDSLVGVLADKRTRMLAEGVRNLGVKPADGRRPSSL
ncbi:transaldolase [uncultured Phenylobacterium sp.]|uniref:transaldolase n=1 Tax=uncultured Phenylobacterium sp. TaxID=349273 RepID=UPI0025F31E11|nr:transaldolase [uncultured Phenylobacterium sp.]